MLRVMAGGLHTDTHSLRISTVVSLLAALLAAAPASAQAAGTVHGPPALESPTAVKALEMSLDSLLSRRMAEYHLPGLAVVAVRDGEVLLLKGYDYADREMERPVDPRTTLFRIASVSKPVTATAAMQLVEQGRLDLRADLRTYLPDAQLDLRGEAPLTMAHLLTHTAALDEQALRRATRDSTQVRSLASFLAAHPPRRIGPPGHLISYNDVGLTLAGRVVEVISGLSFPEYAEEHIFRPLGMHRTTFAQILPDTLRAALATGYDYRRGEYRRVPYDYIHQTPAAGLTTTAADMARFLIAHLEGGQHHGTRILRGETIREMHDRQFAMDPQLQGAAFGLWEIPARGQRALWHGGDWNGYGAVLLLLPEQRAGIFAAFNGRSGDLPYDLMGWFASRMIPERTPTAPPTATSVHTPPDRLTGTYRFSRYSRSTMATLPTILSGQAPEERVTGGGDGTLTIFGRRWVEVKPLLFHRADGNGPALRFIQDAGGRTTHMVLNGYETFERVPWYGSVRLHLALLGLCLVSFAGVLIGAGAGWVRSGGRAAAAQPQRGARHALAALIGVAAIGTMLLLSFGAGMAWINPLDFMAEIPTWTLALLVLPILSSALTAALPVYAVRAWRRGYWTLPQRVAYSAATLAAVAFVWVLAFWNLVGFRLG